MGSQSAPIGTPVRLPLSVSDHDGLEDSSTFPLRCLFTSSPRTRPSSSQPHGASGSLSHWPQPIEVGHFVCHLAVACLQQRTEAQDGVSLLLSRKRPTSALAAPCGGGPFCPPVNSQILDQANAGRMAGLYGRWSGVLLFTTLDLIRGSGSVRHWTASDGACGARRRQGKRIWKASVG